MGFDEVRTRSMAFLISTPFAVMFCAVAWAALWYWIGR